MKTINGTLRAIIFSYLTANIISGSMVIYSMVNCIAEQEQDVLNSTVNISIVVSLGHLLLLLLHYYLVLTSNRKENVIAVIGLLLAAWITSATIATLLISSKHGTVYCTTIVLSVVVVAVSVKI